MVIHLQLFQLLRLAGGRVADPPVKPGTATFGQNRGKVALCTEDVHWKE